MIDALYISATGLQAQQLNVDTIANNLANVNTSGFKKGRVGFTDLMALEASRAGTAWGTDGTSDLMGPLAQIPRLGAGVGISSVAKLFTSGTIAQTGSSWDLAIQGDGFLEVAMPDGTTTYTRGGSLKVNRDGLLTTASGQPLKPGISVPANATSLAITSEGTVSVTVPNQTQPVVLGQLQMVRFSNPSGLVALGDGLYRADEASGESLAGPAGQDGIGTLVQGALEGSNVKLVDEMVSLMVAQRTYQASAKVIQTSDDMLGMINNLRK